MVFLVESEKVKDAIMPHMEPKITAKTRWSLFPKALTTPFSVAQVEDFAAQFGIVSRRDGGHGAWPIKPRKDSGTHSETLGEARFHTDAQYHERPERAFILACECPAQDGGENLLLSVEHAREAALESVGEEGLDLLEQPIWSWRTPSVFRTSDAPECSPDTAVFQIDGTMRWRFDNLVCKNEKQADVATRFADALDRSPHTVRVLLEPGDVLLCDNWYVLHARTHFQDRNRLLYRVRLE